MVKLKGTSKVPIILGIIGGLIGIPCTMASLSVAKSAGIDVDAVVKIYMYFAYAGCGIGFIFSFFAKKLPIISGTMLLVAAACVGISIIGTFVLNVPTFLLFLIGAIVAFAQKRVPVE
jgi:hypothetical protein